MIGPLHIYVLVMIGPPHINTHCHNPTCRASRPSSYQHSLSQPYLQGLKAILMSTPYDCPTWTPEILMALVPAAAGARQPAAVRAEASAALSEFKRTHEQDSLESLKVLMGPDNWESLQAVTSSASYFA